MKFLCDCCWGFIEGEELFSVFVPLTCVLLEVGLGGLLLAEVKYRIDVK